MNKITEQPNMFLIWRLNTRNFVDVDLYLNSEPKIRLCQARLGVVRLGYVRLGHMKPFVFVFFLTNKFCVMGKMFKKVQDMTKIYREYTILIKYFHGFELDRRAYFQKSLQNDSIFKNKTFIFFLFRQISFSICEKVNN